jgi:hypothetical protein
MQIGRKIYYELSTGSVLVNTGDREGYWLEQTKEQDFEAYVELSQRVPSTVGCIQLSFGELAQEFMSGNGYHVDITQTPHVIAWDAAIGQTLAQTRAPKEKTKTKTT